MNLGTDEDTLLRSQTVVVPQVRAICETVYGINTHYVEAGKGQPVILVHGGGPGASGASGWARLLPLLSRHYHVLAIDLIGSGYTDKPVIDYSFQTLVEHLAGFIDVLGLHHVRLVGNSQGGYVAMKYALDHPARVQQVGTIGSATLASAVGVRNDGRTLPLPHFDGSRPSLAAFLKAIVNDPAQLTEELIDTRFAVASQPGHRKMLDSLWRYRDLLAKDGDQQQVFEVGYRLAKLTVPWLMIWGADDRTAPLDSVGAEMRARFTSVPFYEVPGAGHQAQTDQPQQVYEFLMTLFGQSPAVSA